MGDKVTVTIRDGGPWGFRLFGGEGLPLTIARLRRKSKGHEAGLQEGDVLLSINGYTCKDMSHATAMTLIDTSGEQLTMTILRGSQDPNAVDAAFQTLGQAKAIPTHALQGQPRSQTYNGYNNGDISSGDLVQTHHMNGPSGGQQRTQQTFVDGDKTRQVTTETSQQKFGSTTVTKVRREEVTTSGGAPWSSPRTQQRHLEYEQTSHSSSGAAGDTGPGAPSPMFNVKKYESSVPQQQKPGVWAPSSGGGGLNVSAPEGVHVQHNADQSVTMTIGMASPRPDQQQETVSNQPAKHVPQFSVSKVGPSSKQGVWAPAGGSEAPVLRPFTVDVPQTSPRPARKAAYEPEPERQPEPPRIELDDNDGYPAEPQQPSRQQPRPHWSHFDPSARDSPITRIPENPPQIERIDIAKLIKGESFSDDEDQYSPGQSIRTFFNKKIYADSSFYDDPEARYPTIEEQIKMARKVALSLMAPANKRARGHKMFMKRLHKSSRWVAGAHPEQYEFLMDEGEDEEEEDAEDVKYYNPNPWKSVGHTWQPPTKPAPVPPPKPAPGTYQPASLVAHSQMSPGGLSPGGRQGRGISPGGGGTGAAPTLGIGTPKPVPYQLQKEMVKPSIYEDMALNPAYKPSVPKPFRLSNDETPVTDPIHQEYRPAAFEEPDAAPSGMQPVSGFEDEELEEEKPIPVAPPPPPPPVPTLSQWSTPIPSRPTDLFGEDKENEKKVLSPDEFEKIRLYGKKTMHNMVSPQVCFSLADDLRNMKGKGGKLFAKRRAKAEKWVVEDKTGQQMAGPNKEMMAKLLGQAARDHPMSPESPVKSAPDTPDYQPGGPARLQALIKTSKSARSPWEAAMEGDVEKAFDHLNYYTLPSRGKMGKGAHSVSLLDLTSGTQYTSSNPAAADAAPAYCTATTYHKGRPQTSASSARTSNQPAVTPRQQMQPLASMSFTTTTTKLPDYTRKIQPWGVVQPASSSSGPPSSGGGVIDWSEFADSSGVPQPAPASSFSPAAPRHDNYNRKSTPWRSSGNFDDVDVAPTQFSAPSSGSSGGRYKPVQFKAPTTNFGAFTGAPTPAGKSIPVGGATDGYSDL